MKQITDLQSLYEKYQHKVGNVGQGMIESWDEPYMIEARQEEDAAAKAWLAAVTSAWPMLFACHANEQAHLSIPREVEIGQPIPELTELIKRPRKVALPTLERQEICPCGFGEPECEAIHCGEGHTSGQCPPYPPDIEITTLEDAQKCINRLNKWAVRDSKAIVDAQERIRFLERRKPWWLLWRR